MTNRQTASVQKSSNEFEEFILKLFYSFLVG